MGAIMVVSLVWLVTHLGLSSTPVRQQLVGGLSERGFLAIYSIVALASLAGLIWTYTEVPRYEYFWLPNPDWYWLAKLTMPIAFIFLLGGFMVPNPSNVGVSIDDPEHAVAMARGVTRITRHPFQWSVIIWSAGHIAANGDQVSVVFFGSFLLVSGLGTVLLDRKKQAKLGEGWARYAAVTSNVPFVAIVRGRNRLVLTELWLPILVGLGAYALMYYFHEALTGAWIV